MPLITSFNPRVRAILTATGDLGNPEATIVWGPGSLSWASGTGASQADMVYADTITVGTSSTTDLDLAGGCANYLTGANQTFATMKFLGVYAAAANGANVHVIGKATTGVAFVVTLGDGVIVKPGGWFELGVPGAGYTVTAGGPDIISITNPSGSVTVTCDILIIGTSA